MTTRTALRATGPAILALAALLWAGPADAQRSKQRPAEAPAEAVEATHRVEFVNRASARIVSIYVSSSRDHDWGDDLLGDDELDARATASVTFKGPCRADVKVDFEGGASESRRFVDVCRFPSLVIEPGWTLKPLVGA